jgi:hypothetical protein
LTSLRLILKKKIDTNKMSVETSTSTSSSKTNGTKLNHLSVNLTAPTLQTTTTTNKLALSPPLANLITSKQKMNSPSSQANRASLNLNKNATNTIDPDIKAVSSIL